MNDWEALVLVAALAILVVNIGMRALERGTEWRQ